MTGQAQTHLFLQEIESIREVYTQSIPLIHIDKPQADVFE
jgi:hypothetical protein